VSEAQSPRAQGSERPLGPAERFYWLCDRVCPTSFTLGLELRELPPQAQLRRALDEQQAAWPSLSCRVELEGGTPWLRRGARPAPLHELHGGGERGLREVAAGLDRPFLDPAEGPLRAVALRGGPTRPDLLLLSFRHALLDGRAALVLVEDLARRILGEPGEGPGAAAPAPPPLEAALPAALRGWRGRGAALRGLLLERLGGRDARRAQALPPLPRGAPQRRELQVVALALPPHTVAGLERTRRALGCGWQALLGAAQLQALAAELPRQPAPRLCLGSAADLRPRLHPPQPRTAQGMYAALIPSTLRVGPAAAWLDDACRLQADLDARRARGEPERFWAGLPPAWLLPADACGARRLERLLRAAPACSVLTQLGWVDRARPWPPDVLRVWGAMGPQLGAPLCVTGMGLRGTLELRCCLDRSVLGPARGRRVLARLHRLLRAAGEPGRA